MFANWFMHFALVSSQYFRDHFTRLKSFFVTKMIVVKKEENLTIVFLLAIPPYFSPLRIVISSKWEWMSFVCNIVISTLQLNASKMLSTTCNNTKFLMFVIKTTQGRTFLVVESFDIFASKIKVSSMNLKKSTMRWEKNGFSANWPFSFKIVDCDKYKW